MFAAKGGYYSRAVCYDVGETKFVSCFDGSKHRSDHLLITAFTLGSR